ncbi:hypothetical protein L596_002601 [Steinernema carpocapsae]|uniref:DNA helicase n=1 Tax=Steinernema carpocapsae TaxID=34508 RepID=A0A4U8UQ82_STECR|nr:hypothetical protein L596_002601 [Steinernema carpocapsae]
MDPDDSFECDVDLLSSNVDNFPSLLTAPKIDLAVTAVNQITLEEKIVDGVLLPERNVPVRLKLREMWTDSDVKQGNQLKVYEPQLSNAFSESGGQEYVIDNRKGVLIVEPNVLVSSTTISQSFFCQRKAVLLERFRGGAGTNAAMLIGSCVHMLFQAAIATVSASVDESWLLAEFNNDVLPSFAVQLSSINMTPAALEAEVKPYFPVIVGWLKKHLAAPAAQRNAIHGDLFITDVVDIEENNWIPALGVKGKIDVSLRVRNTTSKKEFVVPLELKTGRSKISFDHQGQVLLYCMMLSLRKNLGSIEAGYLLYLKDGTFRPVQPKAVDLKGILKSRNEIAAFLSKINSNKFPAPLSSSRNCSGCAVKTACAVYQRTTEQESFDQASQEMKSFVTDLTEHLSSAHMEYFIRWTRWVMMEWTTSEEQKLTAKSLWLMKAKNREDKGHCVANATLFRQNTAEGCAYLTFTRNSSQAPVDIFSKGDFILISTDYEFAVAMGSVVSILGQAVEVRCDKAMRSEDVGNCFHLDKHESVTSYTMNLANVSQLMDNNARRLEMQVKLVYSPFSNRLRNLIIDLAPPTNRNVSRKQFEGVVPIIKKLNKSQSTAVFKSLFAQDYVLIEGYPGSGKWYVNHILGKTTTICSLIECLEKLGRTVLITAYTNSAVDNILKKLVNTVPKEKILRIGTSSVHPDVSHLTLESKLGSFQSSDRLTQIPGILSKTPIVATTCLMLMACSHNLFSWRRFDMCVVDEASLVTESTILASLMLCETFVLVGDKQQLCPLVINKNARDEGMAISLFERLSVNESFVVPLHHQYRMNQTLSNACSKIFYGERMLCGSDDVANQILALPNKENVPDVEAEPLRQCWSSSQDDSIVMYDTRPDINETCNEANALTVKDVFNAGEAQVISKICTMFIELGALPSEIGVMSLYRYQVEILKTYINDARIEVNTVDQYQGREKEVIILSMVHTDESKNCKLLLDERRINVALSRARCKLIIVGSVQACMRYKTMQKVLELLPNPPRPLDLNDEWFSQ